MLTALQPAMRVLQSPVQVYANIYLVYHEFPHHESANVYAVLGEKVALVDCGHRTSFLAICANMAQLGVTPADIAQIVLTHEDLDHADALPEWLEANPNIRVRAHPQTLSSLRLADQVASVSFIYEQYQHPLRPLPITVGEPLADGEYIQLGDDWYKIIYTPGHSEGSICFWRLDGSVIFTGDAVLSAIFPGRFTKTSPLEALVVWKQSLDRLASYQFSAILCGHEGPNDLPISRERFERLRRTFGSGLNPWFSLSD